MRRERIEPQRRGDFDWNRIGQNAEVASRRLRGLGAVEAVGDGVPLGAVWDGFDEDPLGAQVVAAVEFGVEGAGVSVGVVGDQADAGEAAGIGDAGVRDDVTAALINVQVRKKGKEFGVIGPRANDETGAWGIVAMEHARALEEGCVICRGEATEHGDQGFAVNNSGTQEARRLYGRIDDGGFDAYMGRTAINDKRDLIPEGGRDMAGGGWREAIGRIGAWGGQGKAAFADDGLDEGMIRPANADGIAASGDNRRDGWSFGENDGERSRPESPGQIVGRIVPERDTLAGHVESGHVDDDRIASGAAFDFEDFTNSARIQGVCGETVNGFGGKGDDFAGAQEGSGALDGGIEVRSAVNREDFRHG